MNLNEILIASIAAAFGAVATIASAYIAKRSKTKSPDEKEIGRSIELIMKDMKIKNVNFYVIDSAKKKTISFKHESNSSNYPSGTTVFKVMGKSGRVGLFFCDSLKEDIRPKIAELSKFF